MQRLLLLLLILTSSLTARSQATSSEVDFNTASDLPHNFIDRYSNAPTWITYSPTNGINNTGALVPPNTVSWRNDVISYKKKYTSSTQDSLKVQISFKYNRTLVNPNDYQRAAAIFFESSNNHNILFYLNIIPNESRALLSVTSYGYAQSSSVTLQDDRWYTLEAVLISKGGNFGDEVFAATRIYDRGVNGLSSSQLVGAHKAQIFDIGLATTEEFVIQLSGAKWGGAEYLDNFKASGKERCLTENHITGKIIQDKCYELNGQQFCEAGEFMQSIIDENRCETLTHPTLYKTYVDTTYVTVTDTLIINTMITGIGESMSENKVKVFPNPANSVVNFDFGDYQALAECKLVITNLLGQVKHEALVVSKSQSVELNKLEPKAHTLFSLLIHMENV